MDNAAGISSSVRVAYEKTTDYDVRVRTHELYSVATPNWSEWLLQQVPREGVRAVLDIGCGTGGLLRQLAAAGIGERWVGIDQSEAMAQKARALADETGLGIEYRQGDINNLPYEQERFDLICACHMLYHVPDITEAVRHCGRLLSPQGTFLATTNSRKTMSPHFQAVWSTVLERLPRIKLNPDPGFLRFTLENGAEHLVPSFDHIEVRVRRDAFRFTETAPWADYLKSGRSLEMPTGHTEEDWHQVVQVIDDVVKAQFTEDSLTVPKTAGVFLCSWAQAS